MTIARPTLPDLELACCEPSKHPSRVRSLKNARPPSLGRARLRHSLAMHTDCRPSTAPRTGLIGSLGEGRKYKKASKT